MTITAPTLDTITGNTVMVKMRELIKQMTVFAKEVADLVNTIPTDVQDTYSRDAIDEMIDILTDELNTSITTLSDSVYHKSEVYTKNEVNQLNNAKQDTLIAGNNITIENNVISAIGGSGGMIKLKSGTITDVLGEDTITIDNYRAGTYIINVPNFGGVYLASVIDDTYDILSSNQINRVTPQGGTPNTYLLAFKGTISDTTLSFRIWYKEVTALNTTWYNIVMPAGTHYEVYFIPTLN